MASGDCQRRPRQIILVMQFLDECDEFSEFYAFFISSSLHKMGVL